MLPIPDDIRAARIADVDIRYPWDEWKVTETYRPGTQEVFARMEDLTHRANVAMLCAMLEWLVWRYAAVEDDEEPHDFVEAAWASVVHTAYATYVEFEDDDWRGPVRGPLRMGMAIAVDLIWGVSTAERGRHCAWMDQLLMRVLTDPGAYLAWRDRCMDELCQRYGEEPADDLVFADEQPIGDWVPRELFFGPAPPAPGQVRALMQRFVATLDHRSNPFLQEPADMLEFPDYHGTPYQLTDADD